MQHAAAASANLLCIVASGCFGWALADSRRPIPRSYLLAYGAMVAAFVLRSVGR